jgi:ISXO2-like transposase domain/Transposase zinc-ribbon domain
MQTLDAFDKQFPTDEACKEYIVARRWPDGVRCPRCGAKEKVYALKARPYHWACKNTECGGRHGYRFSVLTATIFQDTKVGLKLWFKVGYLMLTAKKGISALQIHRVIFGEESGSDWRTSWYMCHRWRAAMRGDAFPLDGQVEIDEMYVGGAAKNAHRGNRGRHTSARPGKRGNLVPPKVGVIGAISRKGNVVAKAVETMDGLTVRRFIYSTVSDKVSLVATDEAKVYEGLKGDGYPHEAVDHTKGEYVRGEVHTANLDSFWSLFKRGVMGSFHHVSGKYLPLYLNEFSYRHNNRGNANVFAELVATCG